MPTGNELVKLSDLGTAFSIKLDKDFTGLSAANTFSSTDIIPIAVTVNNVTTTYKLTGATLAAALAGIGNYLTTGDLPLAVNRGGTGAATAAAALAELGAAATADISDAYSSSNTYAVGDLCIHDNRLYECTDAIDSPEAWTEAHWTAKTLDELVVKYADIVNNLTSGGTTVPLSAEMGKKLAAYSVITKVQEKIGEIVNSGDSYTTTKYCMMCGWIKSTAGTANYIQLNGTQVVAAANDTEYVGLPLKPGTVVTTRSGAGYTCMLKFYELEFSDIN